MAQELKRREAVATRNGDVLTASVSHSLSDATPPKDQRYPRSSWDGDLAAWFDTHVEGDSVDVEVVILTSGPPTVALRDRPLLPAIATDPDRLAAVTRDGGFVNPYTFVPAPPRVGLPPELDDARASSSEVEKPAGPPSHACYSDGQWTGFLSVTITTLTPLLLPDTERAGRDGDQRKTFDVRLGPDDRPLITGSSLKGSLRSAYEIITASRFGVFRGHETRLAYRIPAREGLAVIPAVVESDGGDGRQFRLCLGDSHWRSPGRPNNEVQAAAWVPAYAPRSGRQALVRVGGLAGGELAALNGKRVIARCRLYQYEKTARPGRFQVWRATHIAPDDAALRKALHDSDWNDDRDVKQPTGSLTLVAGVASRTDVGTLSITGHSIATKHDERFFVESPNDPRLPLGEEHKTFWKSVIAAYDEAAEGAQPQKGLERSAHVRKEPGTEALRALQVGSPVFVTTDRADPSAPGTRVTGVHPVMIGRMPFDLAPAPLLDATRRPATTLAELSPADRVFGWAVQGADRKHRSSGYRGRLSVRQVECLTEDWAPPGFPDEGVVLAPLSTPKPTQFRFYASPTDSGGPVARRAAKKQGYSRGGALRGTKVYRWREEPDGYWQPPSATQSPDQHREFLAVGGIDPKQNSRHKRWVREGTVFRASLFVDGMSRADLGALLWLLSLPDGAALRLGGGKPLGFGAVRAEVDVTRTRLWSTPELIARWRSLTRTENGTTEETLRSLAEEFATIARDHPVLAEATESFLHASRPVPGSVHYPRKTREPVAETYEWFVENERQQGGGLVNGWALPNVRDPDQRMPYLPRRDDAARAPGPAGQRGSRNPGRPGAPQGPRPGPRAIPRPGPGQGGGQGGLGGHR